jgi:hypothetical protein
LDLSLAFGDGLTDGTYWEWIHTKARRIFLILVDLNMPDQIFGIIDDSWDDNDLPIALDQVEGLALREQRDEKIERRFRYTRTSSRYRWTSSSAAPDLAMSLTKCACRTGPGSSSADVASRSSAVTTPTASRPRTS